MPNTASTMGSACRIPCLNVQADAAQLVTLKHLILSEMDEAHDSVRFYVLGNHYRGKVEHYGVSPALSVDEPLIL